MFKVLFISLPLVCTLISAESKISDSQKEVPPKINLESKEGLFNLIDEISSNFRVTGKLLNVTSDYWENWVAPYNITRDLPYYLAGYDEEYRPLFIVEFGRWDLRKFVEGGNKTLDAAEAHIYQAVYRLYRSIVQETNTLAEFNVIFDFEGYSLDQIAHIKTLVFILGLFRKFHEILDRHLGQAIFINVSYVAERFVTAIRPVIGAVAERLEVYGNRRDKWSHALSRYFPRDSLPEWYGGYKDYRPIKVFG